MRRELEAAIVLARTLAPEDLPRLLGDLEEIRATALARLAAPVGPAPPDELLDVDQTAKRMWRFRQLSVSAPQAPALHAKGRWKTPVQFRRNRHLPEEGAMKLSP